MRWTVRTGTVAVLVVVVALIAAGGVASAGQRAQAVAAGAAGWSGERAPGLQPAAGSWGLTGNAGTVPGQSFLGTTDDRLLELRVNGQPALRLEPNPTSPNVIAGFAGNAVTPGAVGGTIAGGGPGAGEPNRVTDNFGTVAGGANNRAGAAGATPDVAPLATVGGGGNNTAGGQASTVAGGDTNTAAGTASSVGGGTGNTAGGAYAVVAGGGRNSANRDYATVAGGGQNSAGGATATVGGGYGNAASGDSSTVPGGSYNTASGAGSFAAGSHAKALHDGVFIWGDNTNADVVSNAPNTFVVRASGGTVIYSYHTTPTGVYLAPASGSWSSFSDRDGKTSFAAVDPQAILNGVAALPLGTWSYRGQDPSIRHLGPTAQDFAAAFDVGEDTTHISTVDADGVALAAIQALAQRDRDRDAQLSAQVERLRALEAENAALRERLDAIERLLAAPRGAKPPR